MPSENIQKKKEGKSSQWDNPKLAKHGLRQEGGGQFHVLLKLKGCHMKNLAKEKTGIIFSGHNRTVQNLPAAKHRLPQEGSGQFSGN